MWEEKYQEFVCSRSWCVQSRREWAIHIYLRFPSIHSLRKLENITLKPKLLSIFKINIKPIDHWESSYKAKQKRGNNKSMKYHMLSTNDEFLKWWIYFSLKFFLLDVFASHVEKTSFITQFFRCCYCCLSSFVIIVCRAIQISSLCTLSIYHSHSSKSTIWKFVFVLCKIDQINEV